MIPSVKISKLDNQLGVTTTSRVLAIVGTAASGTNNQVTSLGTKAQVISTYGSGPLAEAGAYCLQRNIPCVFVKASPSTDGYYGSITTSFDVGSTATVAAGTTHPDNVYQVVVNIITGGALGSAGITYQYSLDNGVNFSATQALGTSLTMTLERGVSFALSSSTNTLTAGDSFTVTTDRPELSSSDLVTSLNALKASQVAFEKVLVLADTDVNLFSDVKSFLEGYQPLGFYPEAICNARPRALDVSESEATYLTAMTTLTGQVQSEEIVLCADQCEVISDIDGRRLRMHVAIPVAARVMSIPNSSDAAEVALGALDNVFLVDSSGNAIYHNEVLNPGLDDLFMTTLRSFLGRPPGTYVNNCRVMGGSLSDYVFAQESFIVDRAIEQTFQLLVKKLSSKVQLDPTTGFISPTAKKAIESTVNNSLRNTFRLDVSAIQMTLAGNENLVTNGGKVTFTLAVVPLGYLKQLVGSAFLTVSIPQAA